MQKLNRGTEIQVRTIQDQIRKILKFLRILYKTLFLNLIHLAISMIKPLKNVSFLSQSSLSRYFQKKEEIRRRSCGGQRNFLTNISPAHPHVRNICIYIFMCVYGRSFFDSSSWHQRSAQINLGNSRNAHGRNDTHGFSFFFMRPKS